MPFLYLPDAISLALLISALTLLRHSAVSHCRQELHKLGLEMVLGLAENPSAAAGAGCSLRNRIFASAELAERVTPARLFFVDRFCSRTRISACRPPMRVTGAGSILGSVEEPRARKKLQRILLESDITYGMFYLFGSLSGWALTILILFRLMRRMPSRKFSGRIDWTFDVLEKTFSYLGRRALMLAELSSEASRP